MHWLTILVLGIASNLDNFGIGITFGIKGKHISIASNSLIMVIAMLMSLFSLHIGIWLSQFVPLFVANIIGGSLITLMGLWTIAMSVYKVPNKRKEKANPEQIDKDHNNIISSGEATILGLALSFNCIGTAFGAGVTGLNIYLTTISIGLFSFIFIDAGFRWGQQLSKTKIGNYSEFLSGFSLIMIGLYEIFV